MKKTALTIGLFSLVMVATSFANPAPVMSNLQAKNEIDLGGQFGRNGKKSDEFSASNQNNTQLKSFGSDSQLTRSKVKVD